MVFITAGSKEEAKKIGRYLLKKRLIACFNLVKNVDSFYWWKGKIENAKECLIIAKTRKSLFKKLQRAAKSVHAYDVPEIIAVPFTDSYPSYLKWLIKETEE